MSVICNHIKRCNQKIDIDENECEHAHKHGYNLEHCAESMCEFIRMPCRCVEVEIKKEEEEAR